MTAVRRQCEGLPPGIGFDSYKARVCELHKEIKMCFMIACCILFLMRYLLPRGHARQSSVKSCGLEGVRLPDEGSPPGT